MFKAENELEKNILKDTIIVEGLNWGFPRNGHPEGQVYLHVEQILRAIDDLKFIGNERKYLRVLAITHDSFKVNAKGSGKNHGTIARKYLEMYIDDVDLLNMIELHDKPYSIWETFNETGKFRLNAFENMLNKIKDIKLFLEFVKLDGSVKGKDSEPRDWFEHKLKEYGKV